MWLGQSGRSVAHVIVTVNLPSGGTIYREWRGTSSKRIKEAAKWHYSEMYPGCKCYFGNVWYTTSYGAH